MHGKAYLTGTGIPAGTGRVEILSTGRVRVTVLCYGYGSGSKNAVPADLYYPQNFNFHRGCARTSLGYATASKYLARGLGGVVGLTLPMAGADHGSRPVYYLPCSDPWTL